MAFFLIQNTIYISGRQVVWSYLQVKQQKREVDMVQFHVAPFYEATATLSLITSYMFVIKVLVLLKS